jgi:enoyl-CoA hydratase/carnithine racemase
MSCVTFIEHCTQGGQVLGEVRLNAEKSLNALNWEMVQLIRPKLEQWQKDERICAVLFGSEGEKAFCAGGDIVKLYEAINRTDDKSGMDTFFHHEYALDYYLHTYSKPLIGWGKGIVMGGGMGLFNACHFRVVTETSHLAMPEVNIGLYPDVGASWFLNHLPRRNGLFLGLTACAIYANDAVFLGLADRAIANSKRAELLDRLLSDSWTRPGVEVIDGILRQLETESQATFRALPHAIQDHQEWIDNVMAKDSVVEMVAGVLSSESDDPWINKIQSTLKYGSPVSMHIIKRQLERCRHASLKEVFQTELDLTVNISRHRELPEGIRALLIDKDRQPQWTYKTVEQVDERFIDGFFDSPWTADTHPLRCL